MFWVRMIISGSAAAYINQEALRDHLWNVAAASPLLLLQSHAARTAAVDILSGTLLRSHAPALLSGIFIPILQRTNRLWLAAAARASGLHTGIRGGHHEKCGANRNRTSCIQLGPGGSSGRVGYKFRRLHVMQVCFLKPSDARPSRDEYYGLPLRQRWTDSQEVTRSEQVRGCWMCWSHSLHQEKCALYTKKKGKFSSAFEVE